VGRLYPGLKVADSAKMHLLCGIGILYWRVGIKSDFSCNGSDGACRQVMTNALLRHCLIFSVYIAQLFVLQRWGDGSDSWSIATILRGLDCTMCPRVASS
jgi:hypothetical protein